MAVHAELASWLAGRSDDELIELVAQGDGTTGWGVSRSLAFGGHPVFVKAIPVTELELGNRGSTRNLFGLPVVYQYGVGSAGFGAARELAAHQKTTGWVLDGRIASFPLLHHHRLLPMPAQTRTTDRERLDRYVTHWDGNQAIREFVTARERSTRSMVMFIEHIPHVLQEWLPLNQDHVGSVIEQAVAITAFLRAENVAHFDANPSNILTDGERLFFADFGLFLDAEFDLDDDERTFLSTHRYFDIAEFFATLNWPAPNQPVEHGRAYKQALAPYRPLIEEMSGVFARLMAGPKTAAGYDDTTIERLLLDIASRR